MFWGALQAHTVCPGPLWSLLCPHPGLGARTLCPEGRRGRWRPPGQRQGTVLRREAGLAAEGAGLWKPPGWASAVCPGVSYSTSLSCGGLNTEEKEAALSLGRAPAELPPALLWAQIGWSGACGITPGEELCVPPLPFYGPQTTSQTIPCCVSHGLIIVGLPLRLTACGSPVGQAWRRALLQGRERMNGQPGSLSDPQRTRPI